MNKSLAREMLESLAKETGDDHPEKDVLTILLNLMSRVEALEDGFVKVE